MLTGHFCQEFGLSSLLTTRASLFTNVTAGQLLFEGYYDPLLELGNMYMETGHTGGEGDKEDKFGWMVGRNGSSGADGVVTMDTGQLAKVCHNHYIIHLGLNNFSNFGNILGWSEAKDRVKAGELRGSAAGFLSPDADRQFIDFFSTDICRAIR